MNLNRFFCSILLLWFTQLEAALPPDVDSTSRGWLLGNGTSVTEDELIAVIAQHRQAVANYRGALSDYWQPFRGAKLAKVNLADLVLRAASFHKVVYPKSTEKKDQLKDDELPLIDFSHADLRETEMSGLLFKGADFSGATLAKANLVEAELFDTSLLMTDTFAFFGTDFSNAEFVNVSAVATMFWWTDLTSARFVRCNLERATFVGVGAEHSYFVGCNLTNARLYGQFQHSVLMSSEEQSRRLPTNVQGAVFDANLEGIRWEAEGRPDLPDLAGCKNLHTLRSRSDGVELVLLRKYFSEAGLEEARRKITYALRRQKIDDSWNRNSGSVEPSRSWL